MQDLSKLVQNRLFNIQQTIEDISKHPKHKLLDEFYIRINHERKNDGFRILSKSAIAVKIAHLSEQDQQFLFKKCSQSFNFGKMFFGLLKTAKQSPSSESPKR